MIPKFHVLSTMKHFNWSSNIFKSDTISSYTQISIVVGHIYLKIQLAKIEQYPMTILFIKVYK